MQLTTSKMLIGGAVVLVLAAVLVVLWKGREAAERATVTIDHDTHLSVRVADNPWERRQGLSGLSQDDLKAQGMLFVFPKPAVQNFWMKGMEFPLDVVWIKSGNVVAIDRNIPAPSGTEQPATMTSNPVDVDMVLELPAGSANHYDIFPGKPLEITLP